MVMHREWWGSGAAAMIAVLVGESMACTSTVWNARGYIGCSGEGGSEWPFDVVITSVLMLLIVLSRRMPTALTYLAVEYVRGMHVDCRSRSRLL